MSTVAWPDSTLEEHLDNSEVALALFTLLEARPRWMHRRVESVEFRNDVSVRRRISIDFTVPALAPELQNGSDTARLIPLTLIEKRPLIGFDVLDEGGRVLPVLNTDHNRALGGRLLIELAGLVLDKDPSPELQERLRDLATASVSVGEGMLDGLRKAGEGDSETAQVVNQLSGWWLDDLARQFILGILLPADAGERRVVKFAYDQVFTLEHDDRPWRRRVREELGWSPTIVRFDVPSLIDAQGFHFEAVAPDGAEILEAALGGPAGENLHYSASGTSGQPRVHLHTRAKDVLNAQVALSLRVSRRGWLRACYAAAALVFVVMVATAVQARTVSESSAGSSGAATATSVPATPSSTNPGAADRQSEDATEEPTLMSSTSEADTSSSAAALLLALLGVLAALLTRPGEHAMISRLLTWVRPLVLGVALVPFIAAWVVVFGPSGEGLVWTWRVLAVLAGICFVLLSFSYRGPKIQEGS